MAEKILHIEVAKGIGMMMVVMQHNALLVGGNVLVAHMLDSISVPLFFMMSGLFFKPAVPFIRLAADKADGLLKPFFVSCVILAPLQPLLSDNTFTQYVLGTLYGTGWSLLWGPMWFLPHLWLIFVSAWVYLAISQRARFSDGMHWALAAVSVSTGFALFKICIQAPIPIEGVKYAAGSPTLGTLGLPFSADLLPLTVPCFLAGYALRERIRQLQPTLLLSALALFAFVILHLLAKGELNLNNRMFQSFFFNIGETVCGVYLTLAAAVVIARRLPALREPLTRIGVASLFVLLFHNPLQANAYILLHERGMPHVWAGLLAYCLGILIPVLLWQWVVRIPWLAVLWLPFKRVRQTPPAAIATGGSHATVPASKVPRG